MNNKPVPPPIERLAYTVNETAALLGVHRRTIEKKIDAGVLVSTKRLGTRLVSAESVRALFEPEKPAG